ncbi:MAG: hypothetical protein CMJ77_20660 [Planctomycetaceae bacterium]|nr:hypothetical protein [Planctomycetaceae bacterium]
MTELFPSANRSDMTWTLLDSKHRIAVQAISVTAMLMAGYLVFMKWTGQITNLIGCGGDADCANVLGGRWSSWLLIPISGWCLVAYLVLFTTSTTAGRQRWSQCAIVFMGLLLATAAIWFMFLQIAVEQQLCPWCIVLHALGISAAGIIIHGLSKAPLHHRDRILPPAFAMTVLAMFALVTGQIWGPLPKTYQISEGSEATTFESPDTEAISTAAETQPCNPPEDFKQTDPKAGVVEPTTLPNSSADEPSLELPAHLDETSFTPRVLRYFGGELEYEVGDVPFLGKKDAEVFLVKYFDYTCHTCRDLHGALDQLLEKYPDRLGVVVIPCPLNRSCNSYMRPGAKDHQYACELATLGLKVWRADPEKFVEFHEAMFKHQGKVTPAKAEAFAETLVGKDKLNNVSLDLWVPETLQKAINVYGVLSRSNGRMPKLLISEKRVMHGLPQNLAELEGLVLPLP